MFVCHRQRMTNKKEPADLKVTKVNASDYTYPKPIMQQRSTRNAIEKREKFELVTTKLQFGIQKEPETKCDTYFFHFKAFLWCFVVVTAAWLLEIIFVDLHFASL